MKISRLWPLLLVTVLMNGCVLWPGGKKAAAPAAATGPAASTTTNTPTAAFKPIITPDNTLTAKVASYNPVGRFVVLSFPVGQMPKVDQIMFLYRNGLKVGEVKINDLQQDNDIVADLVSGTAEMGDEVREQ